MTETIEQYQHQIAQARTEIRKLRTLLSSIKHEHQNEIKAIKSALGGLRCANCGDTATTCVPKEPEPPAPSTSVSLDTINYKPIGVIETAFHNKRGVPRQTNICHQAVGTVVIDPGVFSNPEHCLDGLEEFSHMWIIFHFHMTESTNSPAKVSPPRLRGERRGVFSTRSPHRACPIGLSLVKIQRIEGNKVYFLGVDMVNQTPVLDIKPYIPQYDYPIADTRMSTISRPQTVGISENMADMQLDDAFEDRTSPPNGMESALSPQIPSPLTPDTPNRGTPNIRGTPDGQERFTPPHVPIIHDGIRIAPWICNPPAESYQVRFTDDALSRLNTLIGDRAEQFRHSIESLLSEDPRSQYVRTRYPDHEYSCVLEDLNICCVFDASSLVCTIVAVRSADDMRDTEP